MKSQLRLKLVTIIACLFSTHVILLSYNIGFSITPLFSINESKDFSFLGQFLTSSSQIETKTHLINPELNSYLNILISPVNLCLFKKAKPFVFIYVFISVKSFDKRQAIRKTWANLTLFRNIRVAFIIGKSDQLEIERQVLREQAQYNDLIQGSFKDAYRNLSYKSLIAWKWIRTYCSNAKYIIKIDDDVSLNTYSLMKFIKDEKEILSPHLKKTDLKYSFLCQYWAHAQPNKEKNSKWYVTDKEYNQKLYGLNQYPIYCVGMAVIMTPDLIKNLYAKSFDLKVFWIDDVYVGLVARFIAARIVDASFLQTSKEMLHRRSLKRVLFIRDCNSVEDFYYAWTLLTRKFN